MGKRANCQVAVSVHAATDTASCPLDWQLYLPREWTDEAGCCRRAGVLDGTVHQEKWRLALGLLDNVSEWGLRAPVVVADAGYGVSTPFRNGLQERGMSYVLALTGKEVAHELNIEPYQADCGGLGPPTWRATGRRRELPPPCGRGRCRGPTFPPPGKASTQARRS
ncbi:transposase [Streptomyces sp. NPDC102409]|uniref:transposase n=1 Tax=Streptomyces sp. NPDC102409 TaxID=3366172 RepID=UPI0038298772